MRTKVNPAALPANFSLLRSKALIYGSEIGAWETNGKPPVDPATGIPAKVTAAKIPVVRYAVYDGFTDQTGLGSDAHTGTILRSDFRAAIQGITATMGAVPWLKLLPIAADVIGTVTGSVFCPNWTGSAAVNIGVYEAVLDEVKNAGYRGPVILESNNEMDFSCWQLWQSQGAAISSGGSVGVSQRIGQHYAAVMPTVQAYAQGLGFSEVVVGAYIGVGGGPGWGQAVTADATKPYGYAAAYSTRWVDEFNNALVAAGCPAPDFEAIHAYPHGTDFTATAGYEFDDNQVYAYYRNWIIQSRARVNTIWGTTVGSQIRFAISEWNAGVANAGGTWSGWTTPGRPGQFYDGWFSMLQGDGNTTGSGTRYWAANCFELGSNSDTGTGQYYNLVKQDGTTPAWYDSFKSASTGGR